MSKDKKPQCPFIQRFAEDLKLAGKSDRTVQSTVEPFVNSASISVKIQAKPPTRTSAYLLFVTQAKKWSSSTVNVALQALKLYYRLTCPRDWAILKLARVKLEQKLPVVISISEVQTLLKLIEKPSMQCYFTVVYHLGLRLNEALHLQVSDIDSKRMMVHIHRGKGAKDRKIPLLKQHSMFCESTGHRPSTRPVSLLPIDAKRQRTFLPVGANHF